MGSTPVYAQQLLLVSLGHIRDTGHNKISCLTASGFVLLSRCWVVEWTFGWMSRIWHLAKDCERLTPTLVGLHFVAFVDLLLHWAALLPGISKRAQRLRA